MTKIVGEIAIEVGADVSPLVRAMERGKDAMSGLQRASDATAAKLKSFGEATVGLGKKLSVVSAAVGLVAAAGFKLAKSTSDSGHEVATLSRIAGTSTDQFQRLAVAAGTVGIEQDKLADILKDVNDKVGDFLTTGGGPMKDFFEKIAPQVGVTAEQFRNLSGADALQLYVSSLEKANLSQQEMTFYMEALASDGTALLPVLNNNGEAVKRLGDAAAAAGAIMSEDAISAAQAFRAKLDQLTQGADGLKNQIGTALMPAMTALMTAIVDKVIPAAAKMVGYVQQMIEWFGALPAPVQEAAGAVALALGVGGPVLLAIGAMSMALGTLVAATGPIGLMIAAAAALGAAWAVWGDDITAMMVKVKDAIGSGLEWVRAQFNGFLAFLQEMPGKLLQVGRDIVQGLIDGLMEKWEALKARVYEMAEGLPNWMKDLLGIHSPSLVFWEIGQNIGQGLANGIKESQGMVASAVGVLGKSAVTNTDGAVSSILGSMGTLFKGSKKFAIAQAGISAWQGAAEALKLPFPANLAAFAQVLATGLGAVKSIQSTNASGGTGGSSTAQSAAPAQQAGVANFTITGDVLGKQTGKELIGAINDAVKQGYRLNMGWA